MKIFNFIAEYWEKYTAKLKSFTQKTIQSIARIVATSWKGAAIGAICAMIFFLIVLGKYLETGISPVLDVLLIILLIGFIIFGIGSISKRLFKIIQSFNPLFVAAFVVTYVMASFLPYEFFSRRLILFELVCGAMVGFALIRGIKNVISLSLIVLVVILNGIVFYFLSFDGFDNSIPVTQRYWEQSSSFVNIEDPSKAGYYKVNELTYGSGNDRLRPEYGREVDIKTTSVDATPFFDQSSGFGNFSRKTYWGFNSTNYPINARVWYPSGEGPFPLVLIVHGNHLMTDYSDPGYEYLGKLMASRGYIFVSVDENFLNASWIGDYNQTEVFIRGWLLLKHLENWREWNKTEGDLFYNKVDMNNIALIGHSRGGPAVVTAAALNKLNRYHNDAKQKFDFNFSIKGVIQIAPNDPYNPHNELQPENINYLVLHGGFDGDVYWFHGNRVYNRIKFTDGNYHFKSALYIYRANHGQFNTVWGRKDLIIPASWFLNLKPIMDGDDQRQIAKLYVSAFLDATLKDNMDNISLFKDYRKASNFLPKEYYINQFEDSKFQYIADFQEDFDVNTASLIGCNIEGVNLKTWRENALLLRDDGGSSQQTNGVYLGWDTNDTTLKGTSQYIINIPDNSLKSLQLDSANNLFFFICNNTNDLDSLDFTIELSTKDTCVQKSFNSFRILPPVLKTKLTKTDFIFTLAKDKPVERVLQYVELPFSEFAKDDQAFNPFEINKIRFIFDKTSEGELFLDRVGMN